MFLPAKVSTVSVNNPLLQPYDLPPFSAIRAEHVQPAIEQILADNRAAILETVRTGASGIGRGERILRV